jgi:UTP--glucose-1-phosphate uridylyltransferase
MFGMYLMTPKLLTIIEKNVAHNKRDAKGNFGITEAMDELRREDGVSGFVVQGERFDLGTPAHLKQTGMSYTSNL